jgi:hypothetical protein
VSKKSPTVSDPPLPSLLPGSSFWRNPGDTEWTEGEPPSETVTPQPQPQEEASDGNQGSDSAR